MKSLVSSVYVCLDCSDVGFPLSVGLAVRVRNFKSERYTFSADITLCHILHLQFYIQIIIILSILPTFEKSTDRIISQYFQKCKRIFEKTEKNTKNIYKFFCKSAKYILFALSLSRLSNYRPIFRPIFLLRSARFS